MCIKNKKFEKIYFYKQLVVLECFNKISSGILLKNTVDFSKISISLNSISFLNTNLRQVITLC